MHGEVEGDAPHDDQSELEPLHLPGDGAAAPCGRPVLKQLILISTRTRVSRDKRQIRQSLYLVLSYNGEVFKL